MIVVLNIKSQFSSFRAINSLSEHYVNATKMNHAVAVIGGGCGLVEDIRSIDPYVRGREEKGGY